MKMPTFLTHFCEIMRKFGFAVLVLTLLSSCGGIIYAIRGPKYEGKFKPESYPEGLDSTKFYYTVKDYGGPDSPDLYYYYLRFRNNGRLEVMGSQNQLLTNNTYDSLTSVNGYPGSATSFVYKKRRGVLKWEFYSNFYNGSTFYKARVVGDSIVKWQALYRRVNSTYIKVPD